MSVVELSIVVPVYNTGNLVEKSLLPLLKLNDDSLEIICVNDGSTDDSLDILQKIQNQYPHMKILNKENGGLSSARNSGLELVQGNYILFLDSDDWLDIEAFLQLKEYCQKDFDIIHGNFNYAYDNKESIKNKLQYETEGINGQEFLNQALLTNKFSIPVWINLYKKDFLLDNQLRFMEGIYHEDEEFNLKAFSIAKHVMSKNIYFYEYYQRQNSITNNDANSEKRFLDILKISEEIHVYSSFHQFRPSFMKVLETYLALIIISGYIRIKNREVANKYYLKMKELKLYQIITPYKFEFQVIRYMIKYCPKLFFRLYQAYFTITSKKV